MSLRVTSIFCLVYLSVVMIFFIWEHISQCSPKVPRLGIAEERRDHRILWFCKQQSPWRFLLRTDEGSPGTYWRWTVGGRGVHNSVLPALLLWGQELWLQTTYHTEFSGEDFLSVLFPALKQITFYLGEGKTSSLNNIWKISKVQK